MAPAKLVPGVDADHFTAVRQLDPALLKRHQNFGYTEAEMRKYFNAPQEFEYDTSGMSKGLIKPPPTPGVHPRVLFYPEEVPALRKKLTESRPGKMAMNGIRKALTGLIAGPNAKYAAMYADAVQGKATPGLTGVEPACAIEYEAFRCLIDDDEAGAKRSAAALATLAEAEAAELDADFVREDAAEAKKASPANANLAPGERPYRDYQRTKTITQAGMLGLAYDFIYNWMTPAQRDTVRATIAKGSANMTAIGDEGLPAFPATTSNWIPMHMRLILLTLAIEGEAGYDPTTIERCAAGYRNYLSAGFFPGGEMFESMGKNFICTENLVPIANRGDNLLALKRLRVQTDDYYLASMDPWGGHFTFYDSLGGRGNTTPMFDVMVLKHYFPKDAALDFVYRNTIGENYEGIGTNVHFGHAFHLNDGVVQAIFAEEYDASKSWEEAQKSATAGKPLTYFSADTGNHITRSAWDKGALQLFFLTRSVAGGRVYCDRTHFSIHAQGRYWAIYKPLRQVEEHYAPKNRSVILVDENGPGMAMAKCLDMQDKPEATFVAADAGPSYAYTSGGNNRFPNNSVPVPFSGNDFRFLKSGKPWMDAPWSDLPNWQTSLKGSEQWLPHHPLQRAFRTAGLVRGKHPYTLITDDFQKDQEAHQFDWGMILEDDVMQVSTSPAETILGEGKSGPDARYLLVRVLNAEGLGSAPVSVEKFDLPNPPVKPISINRFSLRAHCVAPDFKMLLFPYRGNEERPKTTWNSDRSRLAIEWSDQKDLVVFSKAPDGRTRLRLTRDGNELAALR